jgi:hypothetical protein
LLEFEHGAYSFSHVAVHDHPKAHVQTASINAHNYTYINAYGMHMLGIRIPNQLLSSANKYSYSGPANHFDKIQTLSAKKVTVRY